MKLRLFLLSFLLFFSMVIPGFAQTIHNYDVIYNRIAAYGKYYNFGTTLGTSGYGISADASGNVYIKNYGGTWLAPVLSSSFPMTASRIAVTDASGNLSVNSALTSGRILYAGGTGTLSDSADLYYSVSTLYGTNVEASGNVTITTLTASMPIATDASKNLTSWSITGESTVVVTDASPTIKSPSFTNVPTIGSPFILGSTVVDTTGTQFNYLSGATGTTGDKTTNIVYSTNPVFVSPNLGDASGNTLSLVSDASLNNITVNGLTASMPIETDTAKKLVSGTKTGTGSVYVMQSGATLITPTIGAATGTSLNLSGDASANRLYSATDIRAKTGMFTNLTDGYVPYHSSDTVGLVNGPIYTDGTNVGIGTASPGAKLEIDVSDNAVIQDALTIHGTGGGAYGGYLKWSDTWSTDGGKTRAAILGDTPSSNNGRLRLFTLKSGTLTEQVRIDENGNVGIGTTAPDKAVEINSATGANLRLTYNDPNGSATNYADFATTSGGNLTITPSGGTTTIVGAASANSVYTTVSYTKSSTGGGLARGYKEAVSGTLSGASGNISVQVPANSNILSVQLRVDTAIEGATSWDASYNTGLTSSICSGQALTANTKVSSWSGGYTSDSQATDVTIYCIGGNCTAGVVRAIVYYEYMATMPSL